MKPGNYLWGVDLGETKTEAVILCADDPSAIIAQKRIQQKRIWVTSHIIHRIQVLVSMLAEETGITPSHMGFGNPAHYNLLRRQ